MHHKVNALFYALWRKLFLMIFTFITAYRLLKKPTIKEGEADLVIFHRKYGLLILEVKDGGISIENGQWFSENYSGKHAIKNPSLPHIRTGYFINFVPSLVLIDYPKHQNFISLAARISSSINRCPNSGK